MKELYENNENFKRYVDKYCRTYRVTVEVALTHRLVKDVGSHYQELALRKVS